MKAKAIRLPAYCLFNYTQQTTTTMRGNNIIMPREKSYCITRPRNGHVFWRQIGQFNQKEYSSGFSLHLILQQLALSVFILFLKVSDVSLKDQQLSDPQVHSPSPYNIHTNIRPVSIFPKSCIHNFLGQNGRTGVPANFGQTVLQK